MSHSIHTLFSAKQRLTILKMLLSGSPWAIEISRHISPEFFQDKYMTWVWGSAKGYYAKYDSFPTYDALRLIAQKQFGEEKSASYVSTLEMLSKVIPRDEEYLRDECIEFAKKSMIAGNLSTFASLYNKGELDKSIAVLQGTIEAVMKVKASEDSPVDAISMMERVLHENATEQKAAKVPTGIKTLDKIFGGGAHKGFLGLWIARPKTGKTTLLVNLGVGALLAGKRVLHVNYEGSERYVLNRYYASLLEESYAQVKDKGVVAADLSKVTEEFKNKLYVKDFTKDVLNGSWDYDIRGIQRSLESLRNSQTDEDGNPWIPDVIIVDYCDLMSARDKGGDLTQESSQRQAFQDLKSLANTGYVIWTASQTRRPKNDEGKNPETIYSNDIAECYAKVRIADFIGSINMSDVEKESGFARLYLDDARDFDVGITLNMKVDFSRMLFREEIGVKTIPSVESFTDKVKSRENHGFLQTTNGI